MCGVCVCVCVCVCVYRLTGSKALQTIGSMSGGEKARVALSMFVLVPHNLLLLDEPSNHLDIGKKCVCVCVCVCVTCECV